MENKIDQIIGKFQGLRVEEESDWTYSGVFREACADPDVAVEIINAILTIVNIEYGAYGSVNLGKAGATYKKIRDSLTSAFNLERQEVTGDRVIEQRNFSNLRKFLAEAGKNLPEYNNNGTGPGGQGENVKALNHAINAVFKRAYTVLGALKLKYGISNGVIKKELLLNLLLTDVSIA